VKRLSAGQLQLVSAVPAAGGEHVHVAGTTWAGAHAALQQVVLLTTAEDPNTSTHVVQRCLPAPGNSKLITLFVARLIATLHTL
jgi:hypothetical protein